MPGRDDAQCVLELAVFAAGAVSCHPLPTRGTVSIGRSEGNDVRIDDRSVSRRHAVLHLGTPLRIEDLGSANGIRVRREQSSGSTNKLLDVQLDRGKAVEFSVGDAISIGSVLLVVRLCAPGVAEACEERGQPIVRDPAMLRLYELAGRVSASPLSVLLLGETGAGKEVLAEHIHRRSPRAAGPLLRLNCAALTESLLESELFGHEKGAFTSAGRAKPGLLETADKGTVFLDEIGELPPSIQVKLLRVLEDRLVMRVGALHPRPIDVRFVSATNRDLASNVKRGAFREDLFFRLNGISLVIPPLRDRRSEIDPMSRAFAVRAASTLGRRPPVLGPEAITVLTAHRWPGNVRELRNVIERAVVLCNGNALLPEHLLLDADATATPAAPVVAEAPPIVESLPVVETPPVAAGSTAAAGGGDLRSELDDLERRRILDALDQCAGNQTRAAALLGMPRRTFVARLGAYGIRRPRKTPR